MVMTPDLDMRVPPSWDYEPVAPFRLIATDIGRLRIDLWLWLDAIDLAMAAFVDAVLPVKDRFGVVVTDRDDVVVIAHNSSAHWIAHWIGVRAAYDEIGRHELMDPVDLSLATVEAELPWRE